MELMLTTVFIEVNVLKKQNQSRAEILFCPQNRCSVALRSISALQATSLPLLRCAARPSAAQPLVIIRSTAMTALLAGKGRCRSTGES